ncbi:TDT family transporter [Coprococcus sp. AF21-14LB]|uniref:TDT family transporter n=1 Tax=Coprococcus sp. AF21-14LB TaxID=2292231 RepID=UPI000E54F6CB|nr:TDT family transporter [Coprococcus sp. AF21-14LB]QUO32896.1 TDT family transporter [Faecalicatena sp. Marseille-Q4148]RGS78340.1 C4-dicarboxylate ABC transporter [Coprococcus sp. AF21-14LB]
MKKIIQKVPVPLCGVMLGLAALGNLLQSYGEGIRYACGIIAALLLVLILLKLVLFPKMIKEDLQNPIMASVSATFPMALMLLSTYVKPWIGAIAKYIWLFAIALHLVLIIYFTIKFIVKLQMPKVFASYFIVYVGIVVAAVTAPAFEALSIGTAAFWFGFATLLLLLVLVTIRYIKFKQIPEPAQPLICIYAAPTSLCVAGYVQSVTPKSKGFLLTLLVLASILYVFALIKAIGYLKLKFYPSFAAFTFPFVISAIATKQTMACLANMKQPMPFLQYVVLIETIIAVIFVVYTFIRYMQFLFAPKN